jgi:hypothetical protein
MECIEKHKQVRRILKRIETELPRYHPKSGQQLDWDITLGYHKNVVYNNKTGKRSSSIFIPIPQITQSAPRCIRDRQVYRFDWPTKTIVKVGCARWELAGI